MRVVVAFAIGALVSLGCAGRSSQPSHVILPHEAELPGPPTPMGGECPMHGDGGPCPAHHGEPCPMADGGQCPMMGDGGACTCPMMEPAPEEPSTEP